MERTLWPRRAPLLATLGALTGLAVHLLVRGDPFRLTEDGGRLALAAFLLVGAAVLGFVLERRRAAWAGLFALACGVVTGLVTWWNGVPDASLGFEPWRLVCAALAVAIAAPLFQVARDEAAWRFPYRAVHGHAWNNVVLWFAGWGFVLVAWTLAWLLAGLFDLIGIEALRHLLQKGWFDAGLTGAAFGGAIGLLRERDEVVARLQRVVTAVLGVFAPVLGAGLALFLLALPFTGLAPLWGATKSTTPILLGCVIAALILINDVLGDAEEDEARSPPLRYGALLLGVAMLPLALIAAISLGLRLRQYGLTPDRLWALTFVAVASAYAFVYIVALVRRRLAWGEAVRPANLRLAFGLCGVALLLATPLSGFDRIAAHDQAARIADGRTPPERIDWRALRFDMGRSGRAVVERLAATGATPAIRRGARIALAAKDRWGIGAPARPRPSPAATRAALTIFPRGAVVPDALVAAFPEYGSCSRPTANQRCIVRIWPERRIAVLIGFSTDCERCEPSQTLFRMRPDGGWTTARWFDRAPPDDDRWKRQREAAERGDISLRPVTEDRLYLGNDPADAAGGGLDLDIPAPPAPSPR